MQRHKAKRNSFLGGTLAVAAAGVFNSVAGAILRPVMVRLFAPHDGWAGTFGVGLFQIPLSFYQLALSFTAFGMNTAVSRLVAFRDSRADWDGVRTVVRAGVELTLLLGSTVAGLMFFGAHFLAGVSANSQATLGFQLVAPAVLVVTVSAAYRGLFQGVEMLAVVAWSQVLEVAVRVGLSIGLVAVFSNRNVALAAALANGAALAGAGAALIYLGTAARQTLAEAPTQPQPQEHLYPLYREMFLAMVPVALIGALQPMTYLIDTAVAIRQLMSIGWSAVDATAQYGQLFQAYSIINLPPVLGQALYLNLVPAVTRSLSVGDMGSARTKFNEALRYVLVLGIPASVGIWVLAEPIYHFMFGSSSGSGLLSLLAWSTVFLMLQSVSSALLQGLGDFRTPTYALVSGLAVKLIAAHLFTSWVGITGTAWSTMLGFASAAGISLLLASRRVALSPKLLHHLWKVVVANLALGLVVKVIGQVVHVWGSAVLTLQIFAGILTYLVILVALREVTRDDVTRLPLPAALRRRIAPIVGIK